MKRYILIIVTVFLTSCSILLHNDRISKQLKRNEPLYWVDGLTYAKALMDELGESDFVRDHIIQENGSYRCVFKNLEEIIKGQYYGGVTEEYTDDKWVVIVGDVASGTYFCTAYVFQICENDSLMLIGIAGGEPITSKGSTFEYSIDDYLFVISDNHNTVFSQKLDSQ